MAEGIIRRVIGGILGGGKGSIAAGETGGKGEIVKESATKTAAAKSTEASPVKDTVKSLTDPMEQWKQSKARMRMLNQHDEKTLNSAETRAFKEAKLSEDPVKMSVAKVRKQIMNMGTK